VGLLFHVADYYTSRMIRRAGDIAAKVRKRISAALTLLHMNRECNKINSEQEENMTQAPHGTRPWNSLTRNFMKCHNVRCQVITAIINGTKRSASVC
jgi:hypothetical protein